MKFEWKLTLNRKLNNEKPFYKGVIILPKDWDILTLKNLIHNVKILLNTQLKEVK